MIGCLPTQALAFLAVFVYATHATQTIVFEWKPGLSLEVPAHVSGEGGSRGAERARKPEERERSASRAEGCSNLTMKLSYIRILQSISNSNTNISRPRPRIGIQLRPATLRHAYVTYVRHPLIQLGGLGPWGSAVSPPNGSGLARPPNDIWCILG